MTVNQTPEVKIETRHLKFEVEEELKTLWHGGDVFKTCFFNALSMQFPEGEHQFIRAVRHYRDRIEDPRLKKEIRGFIGQEGVHSREHKRYNEALRHRGYDIDAMDNRFEKHMAWVSRLGPTRQLAGTCGAEHYTAVLAHGILSNPDVLTGASPVMKDLWRWHAIEETEHKAVAFDVYQRCIGDNNLRRVVFFFVTYNFFKFTFLNTCTMLKAEGKLWSLKTWLGGLNYLWGKPGVVRKCVPAFLDYLKKDFHPWHHDNRELLKTWEDNFDAELYQQPARAAS
ncbi:MAG: metal-dependent hydrolase [Alteromonadaceae bacterium]|nr:metal-dependent hydrolase [Alteromonadaceae bacterium]